MGFTRLLLTLLLAPLLLAVAVAAQQQDERPGRRVVRPNTEPEEGVIRGRVVLPDGRLLSQSVKITLKVATAGDFTVSYTDQQGQFEFGNLRQGNYTLEAEADREREKYEPAVERVQVIRNAPTLVTLVLREKGSKPGEATRPPGVVTAEELGANVPSKAAEEFARGSRAAREGKPAEAVAHLEKAIALYPEFVAARNDLGTQLLALGRLEEAEEQLREAARLDPKAFNPQLNLAIVLAGRHRFAEAAEAAGRALQLNSTSPAAHLYSGIALAGLEESEKAETELTTAYRLGGAPFALAQFHLGQLYLDRGERALALKAFETYLRDMPDASNAEQVKRVIGVLR